MVAKSAHPTIPNSLPLAQQRSSTFPDEIVEEIIKIAWSQRHIVRRWQLYKVLIGLCHQWQAIMRHISLRFIILECPKDVVNYCRIATKLGETIPDNRALNGVFSRTHIRADVAALGISPPMVPTCRSLELTGEKAFTARRPLRIVRLNPWLRIPGLKSVAFLYSHCFLADDPREACPPPTLEYLHYHLRDDGFFGSQGLPPWLTKCLGNVTHLRISTPQSLVMFVGLAPKLEELTLDLDGITDPCYNIVIALQRGLLPGPKKKIILNTGPTEPAHNKEVVEVCEWLGITLECREQVDPKTLVEHLNIPTFPVKGGPVS